MTTEELLKKRYIGDAVYAQFDGFGITLTTEDGLSISNSIYLEPQVFSELHDYVKQIETRTE